MFRAGRSKARFARSRGSETEDEGGRMRDPYKVLGRQLVAAAERLEAHGSVNGRVRAWFSHRLNASAVAAALVFGGGAAAVAGTGLLSGSPVEREVKLSPVTANGLPIPSVPSG